MGRQTETLRMHLYLSAPFSRELEVTCVWCGGPAGKVALLDLIECQLWIKRGKLCPPCYEMSQEAMEAC